MPLLSPSDSIEEYPRLASELPPTQARCLGFATKLLSRGHHAPHDARDYATFGFCACTCPEESDIGGRRQLVLKKCTFKESCQAYDSGFLLSLFHKAGVPISTPAIVNVLKTSPHMDYSVWDLKQLEIGTDDSKLQLSRLSGPTTAS
ncbi:hypothetical protein BDN71DRAFT_1504708 [Pleurotus eryngii]|uniref:Uncharacterized protein n=1 Tax=Pleurotus eryngii TaxID=5323 RepID=A0A9P6A4P0_PLEER|nr:hypothetical protein BDN71DRAFT_1504708 [Pleurotus eryngii]